MRLKRAERRYELTTADYAQLAAFRRALRGFLHFSESAAAKAGLTARHYQAMLILRAYPEQPVTIGDLSQQLLIKHNSAVELVDRLEQERLIVREASRSDRRKVELRLTGRGRQVLAKLAATHRGELQRLGPVLQRFFADLARIDPPPTPSRARRAAPDSGAAGRRAGIA